jgi:hypothetical protein
VWCLNINLSSCRIIWTVDIIASIIIYCTVYKLLIHVVLCHDILLLPSLVPIHFGSAQHVFSFHFLLSFVTASLASISLVSCLTQSIYLFLSRTSSLFFHFYVHHSSNRIPFLSLHHMFITAQAISFQFGNWCYIISWYYEFLKLYLLSHVNSDKRL